MLTLLATITASALITTKERIATKVGQSAVHVFYYWGRGPFIDFTSCHSPREDINSINCPRFQYMASVGRASHRHHGGYGFESR